MGRILAVRAIPSASFSIIEKEFNYFISVKEIDGGFIVGYEWQK